MITRGIIASLFLIFVTVLTFSACDVISEKGLDESLESVPNVTLIEGAENASIRVNKGTNSYFSINVDNVEWNNLISNGEREAYCIAWKDPISSNNDIYEGVGVYSTEGDEKFKEINRLFSIKDALIIADPEITWREIQVAIWSLVPFQKFDMDMPVNELPSRVRTDGEVNFNKDKVQFILDAVQNINTPKTAEFSGLLNYSSGSIDEPACVIATDPNTQTLITDCDDTAFAYGGSHAADYSQRADDSPANCFIGLNNASGNRWGWSNGPLPQGFNDTFPMYAGASHCILSNGQYAGDVKIDYSGNKVTVTFLASTTFKETHLYVGSNIEPPNGFTANGRFPNNDDVVSKSDTEVKYEVDVSYLNGGNIYVIAHAVVDGYKEEDD